jgi:hypothetical protein
MNPNSIKPAGLPQNGQLATPPPEDPSLPPATETLLPIKEDEKTKTEIPSKNLPKPPKAQSSGNSVTLAIIATVIIVLGIAALAVYAYTQNH